MSALLAQGVDGDQLLSTGDSALCFAVELGHVDMVKLLVRMMSPLQQRRTLHTIIRLWLLQWVKQQSHGKIRPPTFKSLEMWKVFNWGLFIFCQNLSVICQALSKIFWGNKQTIWIVCLLLKGTEGPVPQDSGRVPPWVERWERGSYPRPDPGDQCSKASVRTTCMTTQCHLAHYLINIQSQQSSWVCMLLYRWWQTPCTLCCLHSQSFVSDDCHNKCFRSKTLKASRLQRCQHSKDKCSGTAPTYLDSFQT